MAQFFDSLPNRSEQCLSVMGELLWCCITASNRYTHARSHTRMFDRKFIQSHLAESTAAMSGNRWKETVQLKRMLQTTTIHFVYTSGEFVANFCSLFSWSVDFAAVGLRLLLASPFLSLLLSSFRILFVGDIATYEYLPLLFLQSCKHRTRSREAATMENNNNKQLELAAQRTNLLNK